MSQEVAHHDYELGGLNEWDQAPTQYGQPILQSLSLTRCHRIFPSYLLSHLTHPQPIAALDLGCGPISGLRWGILHGLLEVTGIDPLWDMSRDGLLALPGIPCQQGVSIKAEALTGTFAPASFALAFTRNALDHVHDPVAVVRQVAVCLRPGGIFGIEVSPREGSRQNWQQLHQWDLYLNKASQLVCQPQYGWERALVPSETGLHLKAIVVQTPDWQCVVLEKRERPA